jgi:hypothetical protein
MSQKKVAIILYAAVQPLENFINYDLIFQEMVKTLQGLLKHHTDKLNRLPLNFPFFEEHPVNAPITINGKAVDIGSQLKRLQEIRIVIMLLRYLSQNTVSI